jgi:histidyl-tRNA synthetase
MPGTELALLPTDNNAFSLLEDLLQRPRLFTTPDETPLVDLLVQADQVLDNLNPKTRTKEAIKDVTLRHGIHNTTNTRNNRGFAYYNGQLVEVVRRSEKQTRIRYSLTHNGDTTLVPTQDLIGYHHTDDRG